MDRPVPGLLAWLSDPNILRSKLWFQADLGPKMNINLHAAATIAGCLTCVTRNLPQSHGRFVLPKTRI